MGRDNRQMRERDDWVEDSSLSRDETLRRFRALNPEPTIGPTSPLVEVGTTVEIVITNAVITKQEGLHLSPKGLTLQP